MLQPKETYWLNGYKNKTYIFAVYKRPTSDLGTHSDWKWGDARSYSMQMEIKRKLELQYSYQTKWNLIFKIMLFILFLAALSLHCSIGFTIVAAVSGG